MILSSDRVVTSGPPPGKKGSPLLIWLVVIGAVALAVLGALRNQPKQINSEIVEVVLSAEPIKPGACISMHMLRLGTIPKATMFPGVFEAKDGIGGIVGRIAQAQIAKDEPITRKLIGMYPLSFASALRGEERAMTVAIGGIEGLAAPNDYVDVLASYKGRTVAVCSALRVIACTLLGKDEKGKEAGKFAVTFAALPQQAAFLSQAFETGQIRLLERSPHASRGPVTVLADASKMWTELAPHEHLPATAIALTVPPPPSIPPSQPDTIEENLHKSWVVEVYGAGQKNLVEFVKN